MHRSLLVVAKRPAAGQTKTRLCPPLTGEAAAALYACFLRDTLDVMRQVPDVERGIVYLPEAALDYFSALAPDMQLSLQEGIGLGEWLEGLGLPCVGPVDAMVRGPALERGVAPRVFATITQALG